MIHFLIVKFILVQGRKEDSMPALPIKCDEKMISGTTGDHELVFTIARSDEAQEVYEFLLHHFFPLAPIRQLGLYDESEEAKRPAWIEDLVRDCLRSPYSLLVRDCAGLVRDSCLRHPIVAVAVNEIKTTAKPVTHNQPDGRSRSCVPAQFPVGRLHKAVLENIHHQVDLFSLYQTERKMEFSIVAVDKNYGRQGLASKLMGYSLEIAKTNEVGVVWTEALSEYTAKLAVKFGFDTLKTINYGDFWFEGDKPLANIPGHRIGQLMARKI